MRNWLTLLALALIQLGPLNQLHAQIATGLLGAPDAIVYDVDLITGSDILVANLGDNIQVWDYRTRELKRSWSSPQTLAIACSDDKVASVSKSGNVSVWNLADGREILVSKITESPVLSVAWLDASYLVVGAENGELVKIDIANGTQVLRANISAPVTALLIHDNVLIAGDAKGNINVYDSKDLKLKTTFAAHKSWIRDIKFSPVRDEFVTTSDDGFSRTWKLADQIIAVGKRSLNGWILCANVTSSQDEKSDFLSLGTSTGRVFVDVRVAKYAAKLNSMINSVAVIESELPQIVVALGTHGEGIQLLSAKDMKLVKR